MTLEQENELKFLEILNSQTEYISKPELGKLIRPIIGPSEYEKIFSKFLNSKIYIFEYNQDEDTKHDYGKNKIYSIRPEGRNYLDFLNALKEKEKLANDKLRVDLKNAERIARSYPLTRIAAWIGAISGIILLAYQLPELYNKLLILIKAIKAGHF